MDGRLFFILLSLSCLPPFLHLYILDSNNFDFVPIFFIILHRIDVIGLQTQTQPHTNRNEIIKSLDMIWMNYFMVICSLNGWKEIVLNSTHIPNKFKNIIRAICSCAKKTLEKMATIVAVSGATQKNKKTMLPILYSC